MSQIERRLPIGAEPQPGGVHFRVWAPDPPAVAVVVEGARGSSREVPLQREKCGYLSAFVEDAAAGDRYRFRIGGQLLPDPASRFQPDGPFGPSEVIDGPAFSWTDRGWTGAALAGQVMYELHVGTFTSEGTWRAA